MKKLSFWALAAVGLLLGACASDKDEVKADQNGSEFIDGAFIGVTLQLPSASQNSTRANEDFTDGEDDEFEVKNATLYIFKGASEDAATFVGQYVIGTGTEWESDGGTNTDNVTSTYSKATQISNELAAEMSDASNTANYYAYVIVNNPGVDAVATGVTFAQFKTRQWSEIGTPVAEEEKIGDDGLLMTNAPVCNYAGGLTAPTKGTATDAEEVAYTTLVKLDKSKVYATASAAQTNPAGCIYIERAAVKITVEVKNTVTTVGSGTEAPSISFSNWQIINYPATFYNTRKVDPAWGSLVSYITALDTDGNSDITTTDFANWNVNNQYRFVSKDAFAPYKPTAHAGPFRTYFAEDPTYTTNGGLERPKAVDGKWIAMGKRGFTTENTFDVEHQIWQNTTMVTFKTVVKAGETAVDFYTVNGGDEMYDATNALNKVQSGLSNVPSVKTALKNIEEALIALDQDGDTDPDHVFGYKAALTVAFDASMTASADKAPLVFDFTVTATGANSTKTKDNVTAELKTALTNAINAAKANFNVSYYKGGVTYYTARIQHFGEYETPWSATKPFQTVAPGTTVQQIYGVGEDPDLSANRFLGRYGVVRDNWYKLSVDAVNHIGTAEPVDVSGEGKNTPDDQIENYLSVHVHIVPWVIRNQSITF